MKSNGMPEPERYLQVRFYIRNIILLGSATKENATQVSYNLNSVKGSYIGDSVGEY